MTNRASKISKVTLTRASMTLLLCCTFAILGCLPSYAVPDNNVAPEIRGESDPHAASGTANSFEERLRLRAGDGEFNTGLPGSNQLIEYGNQIIDTHVLVPEGMSQDDVSRRPFLYWRAWANQKIPFLRALLFLLFTTVLTNFIAPKAVTEAVSVYRDKWLRSFGVGILVFTIGLISAGMMSRIGIYAPLGTGVVTMVQLASLLGITVAANSIGDAILRITRLDSQMPYPWVKSLLTVALGALLLSLLVLVPGFGILPRMGARMLSLVAAAGAGAFMLAHRARRKAAQQTQPGAD